MFKSPLLLTLLMLSLIIQTPIFSQQYDPGQGKTLMLIGQTFQNEYDGYKSGTGLTPAGSSHYATLYLGRIEQGDDDPNALFLDHVRNTQENPYALVALSFKDNTAAGGYGQMTDDSKPLNTNAVWDALSDVNSGKWDEQIDNFSQTMKSRPDTKFYLRIGYEVSLLLFAYNNNQQYVVDWLTEQADNGVNVFDNPDSISELDRQEYINAYNYIANRIKNVNGVTNVDFVYHPVRGLNDTKWLYPGSQYVDWVAFSVFNNDVCIEVNGTTNCEGSTIDPSLQSSIDFAKENGHPIMIAEAATQAPATGSSSDFNNYLNLLDKVVKDNDVRVLAYINSNWPIHGWGPEWGDSRVEVNTTVRNHWISKFGDNTRYIHASSTTINPTPATCDDGIQNGNETGIDCGGDCQPCDTTPPPTGDCSGDCPDGYNYYACGQCWTDQQQAQSGGCTETCSSDNNPPSATCNDGVQNGNETGIDCGGDCQPCDTTPPPTGDCSGDCPDGYNFYACGQCWVDEQQAQSGGCTETCSTTNPDTPTCNDGIQNGDETGVDCGGSCNNNCDTTNPPKCNDGIQNGSETGIDCGGSCSNSCDTNPPSGLVAKLLPPNEQILLTVGQDLKTVAEYKDSGLYPTMGGVTQYVAFYSLLNSSNPQYGALGEDPNGTPTNIDINWGAGPLNSHSGAVGFPNSSLSIGMSIAEGNESETWCAGCLNELGNGGWDANIKRFAKFAKDHSDIAIYLRLGFEFDGAWNRYNSDQFKRAWRRFVDVMRAEEVTNVAYVWQACASPVDDLIDRRRENIEDFWPGDDYVDWLGYSWFLVPDRVYENNGYQAATQRQLADEIVNLARRKNKPVKLSETSPQGYDVSSGTKCNIGFIDGTANTGCQNKSPNQIWNEWYTPMFEYVYANKDVIRAVDYINVNWDEDTSKFGPGSGYAEGYWGDARVQSNSGISSRWNSEISKPIWLHGSSSLNMVLLNSSAARKVNSTFYTNETIGSNNNNFVIYPNPSDKIINIRGVELGTTITIYDVNGRKIIETKELSIPISNLQSGFYFVKTPKGIKQFIKKN
ncbi:T9SS type A sorting domain-containing protein [Tenacibaculum sp. 190524A05c]|uniref:T9SS type A sorting domain-containing protein n=2 Tax=Tenacibaculum platacis TaxID=3137852 RepID=A0ABM9NYC4_9FLAO